MCVFCLELLKRSSSSRLSPAVSLFHQVLFKVGQCASPPTRHAFPGTHRRLPDREGAALRRDLPEPDWRRILDKVPQIGLKWLECSDVNRHRKLHACVNVQLSIHISIYIYIYASHMQRVMLVQKCVRQILVSCVLLMCTTIVLLLEEVAHLSKAPT